MQRNISGSNSKLPCACNIAVEVLTVISQLPCDCSIVFEVSAVTSKPCDCSIAFEILTITSKLPCDCCIVFEVSAVTSKLPCGCSIAFEGRVVTVGYASGSIPSVSINQLLLKSCSIRGVWWGRYGMRHPEAFLQSITDVMSAIKEGKLHPHIGKVFPLQEVNLEPKTFVILLLLICSVDFVVCVSVWGINNNNRLFMAPHLVRPEHLQKHKNTLI